MAQKKFAVIGAGQFGQAISLALSEKGFEVLVIDKDMKKVQNISDDVAYAVCTDATDKRALLNENTRWLPHHHIGFRQWLRLAAGSETHEVGLQLRAVKRENVGQRPQHAGCIRSKNHLAVVTVVEVLGAAIVSNQCLACHQCLAVP